MKHLESCIFAVAIALAAGCGNTPPEEADEPGGQDERPPPNDETEPPGDDAPPSPGIPTWPSDAALQAVPAGPTSVRLQWDAARDNRQITIYEIFLDGERIARTSGLQFAHRVDGLDPLARYEFGVAARDDENQPTAAKLTTTVKLTVPDPAETLSNAEAVRDPGATLRDRARHLFRGNDPVQRDVAPDAIAPERISVVSGVVEDADGAPLQGVHVSINGRPELGHTLTRPDGAFTLVVNGGTTVPVEFQKDGYLTAQRRLPTRWQGSQRAETVRLIELDDETTRVSLESDWQLAKGSRVDGPRGQRQGVVYFPAATRAELVLPDGSRQPLSDMTVRITEYTVGEEGLQRMPADLPINSAYTHAMELSVDEARAAGADSVTFNQAVSYYVDNFVGFDVGFVFPFGSYDRQRSVWTSGEPTVVMKLLSINAAGLAELDTNGDGTADNPSRYDDLHITDDEREALASVYAPGDEFWRVQTAHFSPHDPNAVAVCAEGADVDGDSTNCVPPNGRHPDGGNDNCEPGSIIECDTQTLRESIELVGTPVALTYNSGRQFGYASKRIERLSLYDEQEPRGLLGRSVTLSIDGETLLPSYAAETVKDTRAPRFVEFEWDGVSGLTNERVNASVVGTLGISFCYTVTCGGGTVFGRASTTGGEGGACIAAAICALWSDTTILRSWTLPRHTAGGWTFSVHHHLDDVAQTLHLGTGETRHFAAAGDRIVLVAGKEDGAPPPTLDGEKAPRTPLNSADAVAINAEGEVFLVTRSKIYRIDAEGVLHRYAGTTEDTWGGSRSSGFNGDGRLASHALLHEPGDIAFDRDGNLFIADTDNHRVRRVDANTRNITTIAGGNGSDFSGDGGSATNAQLNHPAGIALGDEGRIYIADRFNHRIRHVDPSGEITSVAGGGSTQGSTESGFAGDGGPANEALLNNPIDVDVGPNGEVYIADHYNDRIRRIRDGRILTVAGGGNTVLEPGDTVAALQVELRRPRSVTVSAKGVIYVATDYQVVKIANNNASVAVGAETEGFNGHERAPLSTRLEGVSDVAVAPSGELYFTEDGNEMVRVVTRDYINDASQQTRTIPSADGSRLFVFGPDNKHQQTVDSKSGTVLWSFEYSIQGRLVALTDRNGLTTTVERDGNGRATAIVGPYGHRTALDLYDDPGRAGLLAAVTNPAGETVSLDYRDPKDASIQCGSSSAENCCQAGGANCEGLLSEMVEPTGATHTYTYDARGRLIEDAGPGGRKTSLARSLYPNGYDYEVSVTTGGATTHYATEHDLEQDTVTHVRTLPTGLIERRVRSNEGVKVVLANGMHIDTQMGSDPRFGRFAKIPAQTMVSTPAGRQMSVEMSRSADTPGALARPDAVTLDTTVNGQTTTVTWKKADETRPARIIMQSPMGRSKTYGFDEVGRLQRFEMPGLAPVDYTYDAKGRLTAVTQTAPDSGNTREMSFTHHASGSPGAGMMASMTNGLGETIGFEYDAALRNTLQTFPAASAQSLADRSATLSYDAAGHLTALAPPGRPAHALPRDAAGNTTAYAPPSLQSVSAGEMGYEYNARHQLDRLIYPDGRFIDFVYESETQRLDALALANESRELSYDPDDGTLSDIDVSNDNGVVTSLGLEYDGALLTRASWSERFNASIEQQHDNFFRVSRRTINGAHAVDFAYSSDGLKLESGALTLSYDTESGILKSATLAGGQAQWQHNAFGEVTDYTVDEPSDTTNDIFAAAYGRDALGRIETLEEQVNGQSRALRYEYDTRGRLTEVLERDSGDSYQSLWRYSYGPNGNRTSVNDHFGQLGASDITYDAQDRLLTYGDLEYTYTSGGALATRTDTGTGETTTFNYDAFGNLRSVDLPDGRSIRYPVDGINRRVGRIVEDTGGNVVAQRYWIYKDRYNPVAELDAQGNVVARFVYGAKKHVPAYMVRGGTRYRFVTDHRGSVRLVVNVANGQVAQEIRYDAFGNVLSDTNAGFQPFGFAGGLYEPETGLVRFGVRDYEARTGRWTSKDPLLFRAGDGNLYRYAGADPVNLIDPSGELAIITVVAIGAGLSGAIYSLTADCWTPQGFAGAVAGGAVAALVPALAAAALPAAAGTAAAVFLGLHTGMIGGVLGHFTNSAISGMDLDVANTLGSMLGGATGGGIGSGLGGGSFTGTATEAASEGVSGLAGSATSAATNEVLD